MRTHDSVCRLLNFWGWCKGAWIKGKGDRDWKHHSLSLPLYLWWWGWCKGGRIRGKGIETGDLVTKIAGGEGVGHAATEGLGDGVGAASASVLEHL